MNGFAAGVLALSLVLAGLGCAGEGGGHGSSGGSRAPQPTVLLVSIDGFRADWLDEHDLPHLQRLAKQGVRASRGMIPVFPTKTFPNHYSIVTGLYPSHHGIVSNSMYDPEWDAWFRYKDPQAMQDARWWGGEPIWVTAEKQGLRTATYFWVGSEAPIGGVRPSLWKPYDSRIPNRERVDAVLGWLDLPLHERPRFITMYFSTVDAQGHRHGPDAEATVKTLRRVDASIGRLVEGLTERGLFGRVNLLIVSDHGMASTSPDKVIFLDDAIDLDDVFIVNSSPVLMLRPRAGKLPTVHDALRQASRHLQVYRREELPARWHFGEHRRIPPLIALADEGWTIARSREAWNPSRLPRGMHGYDNALPSMRALFLAHGPAFRKRFEVEPFEIVHLYSLMTHILGLEPAPNDGSLKAVEPMLATPPDSNRVAASGDKRSGG